MSRDSFAIGSLRIHLVVFGVVVMHQALGYLWYSPGVFLDSWLRAQGRLASDLQNMGPAPLVWSMVGNFCAAYAMAWIVQVSGARGAWSGVIVGLKLFAGFALLLTGAHYQFLAVSSTVLWIDLGLLLIWMPLACLVLSVAHQKAGKHD